MSRLVFALAFVLPVAAWSSEPARGPGEPSYVPERAPARLAPSVQIADSAISALQRRLSARLMEELQKGGPARAVAVCRDEAQALTAETVRSQGIRVGRTSHRLRNPGNAAPSWARRLVEAGAGRKAAAVEALVVDLGDRVGVLRPVPTAAMCVQCHGPVERLSPDVTAFLQASYPGDQAVGFEEGDLRGFIWAEAPTLPATTSAPRQEARELALGQELFGEAHPRCTVCHSAAGKGNPQGPRLDGVGQRLGRDEIRAWIRTPAEMAKKRGSTRKPAMVPYPEFSDEELDALVAYLVSLELGPAGK